MGALSSLATVGLNLALAQQATREDSRASRAERNRQVRAVQQQTEEQRRREQAELRRRLAAQRARAGAAGVGGGGSSRAILRGLTEEADTAQAARARTASQRIDELRRRSSGQRRNNLLDLFGSVGGGSFGALGRSLGRSSLLGL